MRNKIGIILFVFFAFPSFSKAATFGYTTLGASTSSAIGITSTDVSQMAGDVATLSEAGTLDSITAGLIAASAGQSLDLFFAIYNEDSAGSGSHDLVASVESLNVAVGTVAAWYTINAASESLSVDTYILAALGNGEDLTLGAVSLRSDSGAPSHNFYLESTSGAGGYATRKAENPWTEVAAALTSIRSIYATYTASAPASSPKIQLKSSVQFKSSVQLK